MFGLAFLAPWFLLGALAAAVPVVLHLRRRETAPAHAFSAVRFLRKAPHQERRPRKLHDLLLLLLRLAACLLLALAFARPYIAGGDTTARTTVVAVDTSFSMGAPGRLARAKQAALAAVSAAPAGDRVSVLRFDDRATVVTAPTLDRGAARAAIADLAAGQGGTDYTALLSTITRVVGATGGRLVIVSDLQRAAWTGSTAGSLPDDLGLEIVPVGTPIENLSVGPVRREGDGVAAQVTNHGFRPRTTRVGLWLNDRSVAEASVTVEPGRSASVLLPARLPSTGTTRASIDDAEGLAADNDRFLVLDAPPAPTVALLGEAAQGEDLFFLLAAIDAADVNRRLVAETLSGPARQALTSASIRERQAVVIEGTRGLDRATRRVLQEYLREGGAMLLIASETLDAGTLEEIVGTEGPRLEQAVSTFPTTLAPVDRRHPIFAAFGESVAGLGQAQFTRALRVVPGQGARTIARFANGLPALVEQPIGRGRLAVFASDLGADWGTFTRQPAFVPFLLETLHYLIDSRTTPVELLVADVAPGVAPRAGVTTSGTPPRPVAINVDLRESAVGPVTAAQLTAAVRRVEPEQRGAQAIAREREASQDVWWYVLLGVAAFLLVEGVLGSRRASSTSREATLET